MFGGDEDLAMKGFTREQILGKDIKLIAATEPTNIIWENRHIRGFRFCRRAFAAILVVTFVLLVSFGVIYAFKSLSIKQDNKFPRVDCPKLVESFSDDE
jgi:hypothetical protein